MSDQQPGGQGRGRARGRGRGQNVGGPGAAPSQNTPQGAWANRPGSQAAAAPPLQAPGPSRPPTQQPQRVN